MPPTPPFVTLPLDEGEDGDEESFCSRRQVVIVIHKNSNTNLTLKADKNHKIHSN